MSNIKIEGDNTWSKVYVDGVEMKCLTRASLTLVAGEPPVVEATLFAKEWDVNLEGVSLRIDHLEMPESVELALLKYLCDKHY